MGLRHFARSFWLAPLLAVLSVPVARAERPGVAPSPAVRPAPVVRPASPLIRPVTAKLPQPPVTLHVQAASGAPAKLASRIQVHAVVRPATPSLDVSVPVAGARQQLLAVRDEVARGAKVGERPVVIFDIDDTLLTWPRPDLPTRQIVPGALAYLMSLKEAGAKIVYITGRHEPARTETIEHLRQHGFPMGADEHLVLNDTNLETVEYKAAATRTVVRTLGRPLAVFDNEKENARMFRRELPDPKVAVVRLRTTSQRPDSGGDGPITVIDDFTSALPKTIHLTREGASVPASP